MRIDQEITPLAPGFAIVLRNVQRFQAISLHHHPPSPRLVKGGVGSPPPPPRG